MHPRQLLLLLFQLGHLAVLAQVSAFRVGAEEGYVEGGSVEAKGLHAKEGRDYYWLKGQRIHVTQGGYAGRLLHGRAKRYRVNGQLQEEGEYHRGLRHGRWMEWWPSGRLRCSREWNKGMLSGWTRIHDEQGRSVLSERYRRGVLKEVKVIGVEPARKRSRVRIGRTRSERDTTALAEGEPKLMEEVLEPSVKKRQRSHRRSDQAKPVMRSTKKPSTEPGEEYKDERRSPEKRRERKKEEGQRRSRKEQ